VAHFGHPGSAATLIREAEEAGLRGHGGAGFPTAVKLAAVKAGRRPAVVVANGTEGEPASHKDKTLMMTAPHLVIDGAVAAATAVGARRVLICIERSAIRTMTVMSAAVAERERLGVDRVPVTIHAAPNRYVGGEESALVHWLNGGEAKPVSVPPRPFERGVDRLPTLVQNVETLAHLALIARYGAAWFRQEGTATDPGTTLVTVTGGVSAPGVYEVPLSMPLGSVLARAGATAETVDAVLVGGYFGTWLPASAVGGLTLERASLQRAGAGLGCGVLSALPRSGCGLHETARVARWLADQSAGQCGPCLYGLDAIAGALADLDRGGSRGGRAEANLRRWTELVKGRGACKHPDGAARFVQSGLDVFAAELDRHRRSGRCAGSRQAMLPVPAPGAWE
jgi:NADH:ubiquinone oxidoreductase subunit F (NADH-binding)